MKHFCVFFFKTPVGILFFLLFTLSACSSQEEQSAQTNQTLKPVKVEVKLNPQEAKAKQEVEIQAIVTQGNEPVEDANDVKFEIWKDENQEHETAKRETIEAKHKGNGVYVIKKTFSEEGIYNINAHTNARNMHIMPLIKVSIIK
ncbi:FixH family protein [Domibacillus robiginosus]|uniref:FixH family protein n=1 Tax=Domibacillus robiginosus TaxID=1071054 RepID=UPI00067E4212|nr:FixH family protein [Domibacillus robiginosus]